MLRQEGIDHILILSGQHRAGGIHQHPAGGHVLCLVFQNGTLQGRQCFQLLQILIADVRLFADDAQTRAGHIGDDRIKPFLPLRHLYGCVPALSIDAAKAQTLCALGNQLRLVGIDVTGNNASPALHGDGGGKALSSRRGAAVQHLHSRLQPGAQHAELRSRVLHIEQPLPEGIQMLQVPDPRQNQAVFHPAVGGSRHIPGFQRPGQLF